MHVIHDDYAFHKYLLSIPFIKKVYKKACYRPVGLKLYLKRGTIDVLVFLIEFSTCMHQV